MDIGMPPSELHEPYLRNLINKIDHLFAEPDMIMAHSRLRDMLKNDVHHGQLLQVCLSQLLTNQDLFSKTRNGPIVGFNLVNRWRYFIQVHCWCPLPNRERDISHNWIHHHENRLLTSLNMFGDGYKSMLFKPLSKSDSVNKQAVKLTIEKEFTHSLGNVEFVPAFTPHLVFIPESLSITFTVWSTDTISKKEALRRTRHLNFVKKPVRSFMRSMKLINHVQRVIDNQVRQFAPVNGSIECVGKINYPESDNSNYMRNLFYILQQTGYNDSDVINSLRQKALQRNRYDVVKLTENFLDGDDISDLYDPRHLNVPRVNFTKDEVVECCAV